ncbi:GTP cyclohydrolase 1 [Fusarium oxysporum f. sp. albedinis]|nr:GTP cyclohydrolase 1 [Fusarium oxysporum f. sp. albedinis]
MSAIPSYLLYLYKLKGCSYKHCGLHSASWKVLDYHLRAEYREKLELTAGKNSRHHWLRDHIQRGVLIQSWTVNNTRRSWLVSTDNDFNGGSILRSILLQASPDPIKLFTQKLFTEEHARLGNQQSGGQRY